MSEINMSEIIMVLIILVILSIIRFIETLIKIKYSDRVINENIVMELSEIYRKYKKEEYKEPNLFKNIFDKFKNYISMKLSNYKEKKELRLKYGI